MTMEIERKVLTGIAKKHGGLLLIDHVLNEARDENSVLHKYFEWDNDEAAENYRRYQARVLIQKCRITIVESEPTTIRAFVSLPDDRESGGGYRLTSTVMSDERLRDDFLRDIRMTIARWSQKLHLLDGVTAEMLESLSNRVNEIETRVNV